LNCPVAALLAAKWGLSVSDSSPTSFDGTAGSVPEKGGLMSVVAGFSAGFSVA
jgi:hypothetical protein